MRDYKNIRAWQIADELALKIYSMTVNFPKEERYTLTSQLRRAAISVATNICEGASRQHKRDCLNFLYVARGSLMETEYLVSISQRLEYTDQTDISEIRTLIDDTQSKLYGLIRSVEDEL